MSVLDEYLKDEDPNKFWRLSSGEHENLLDLALERADESSKNLKQALRVIYKYSMRLGSQEVAIAELAGLVLDASESLAIYGNDEFDFDKLELYHKRVEELTT